MRPAPEAAPTDLAHLTRLEAEVEVAGGIRTLHLRQLHEEQTRLFVNSPGFGAVRMIRGPHEGSLRDRRDEGPVPQPESAGTPDPNVAAKPAGPPAGTLADLHHNGVLDFVNPAGWGLVKDRHHVAGFLPHRMTTQPGPANGWAVRTVDLVGLLRHETPVVYVSAHLPRMDELTAAPTRPLDAFETEGLTALRGGEELFARDAGGRARMVGAIRATKQCVACHGGERGALLGAFSYTLRRGD